MSKSKKLIELERQTLKNLLNARGSFWLHHLKKYLKKSNSPRCALMDNDSHERNEAESGRVRKSRT